MFKREDEIVGISNTSERNVCLSFLAFIWSRLLARREEGRLVQLS